LALKSHFGEKLHSIREGSHMAKVRTLASNDLRVRAKSQSSGRQRDAVPSSELVPLQFRMPREFVRAFKLEALNRGVKLNGLLELCFRNLMKK
jgi:hypothetical protein